MPAKGGHVGEKNRVLVCDVEIDGEVCGRRSRDAYNHRRHLALKHGLKVNKVRQPLTFVHMKPSDFDAPGLHLSGPVSDALEIDGLPEGPHTSEHTSDERTTSGSDDGLDDLDQTHLGTLQHLPGGSESVLPGRGPPRGKRKWSSTASAREAAPRYEVKRSRVARQQQCAISWLTEVGVLRFQQHLRALLCSWGVDDLDYGDSCILVPADWAPLEPREVIKLFSLERCPERQAHRPIYKFDDHKTSLSRAIAWFGQYPRTGIELDNFLGAGPYKTMDGSHLCHHDACINPNHIDYEPSDLNQDRKSCRDRAEFLRREGRPVPEYCTEHEVPCLLRLSALTTYETCLIQFSVLRKALGLPQDVDPEPPGSWTTYRSFETRLPHSAILREGIGSPSPLQLPSDLDSDALEDRIDRPPLVCAFCNAIKGFYRPTRLWAHLVKVHGKTEPQDALLDEIKRTASLWSEYWARSSSEMARKDGITRAKLLKATEETFSWQDVLAWNMR
ncbi:hypothetical protein JX266_006474 [Neoarthrinium moseri]|nr:hypothetical protein JX266_006474 [Neoarthrinium moseri]